ncbi:MAG: MFS transporter [Flavobacteriales bacterium]|jgi:predicted MFS family arabinose efflux permease|uniref:MFS transporter n=1 Tax=Candidatus Ulvibacter alkanivorans TaxID=2267620 RepID=UPI000DF234BB|nr:MFS transporter [Candidatus Ulvibacter alkanivorans]MCH2489615.1 MFS transporter [Flavobacteriales bacterium]
MKKIYTNYISNFTGLSREIWLLALVTFINRAGAMVIPFLSLYLVNSKGFTLPQVGWIMTSFGLGSLVGTWIGGRLTDSIGFYKVIVASLFFGGLGFIALQFIESFYGFCIGIFLLILIADAYRPAIFVASETYSKPENVTRSITLIRLAINLGFSIGPLIGGIIITTISYGSLFWIDGLTCVAASVVLFAVLKPKQVKDDDIAEKRIVKEGVAPYKNAIFILFFIIMIANSTIFVQYFSVMPLYYEKAHFLNEALIGWLLFLNGALIVVFEMPLVAWLERKKLSKTMATFWGIALLALSFIVLNLTTWSGILVIGMILMTLGEMIGSPFSNALALEMAPKGRKGSYMGLYSMSFSISHIIGHNSGMNLVDTYGFEMTWTVMFVFLLVIGLAALWLHHLLKQSPKVQVT